MAMTRSCGAGNPARSRLSGGLPARAGAEPAKQLPAESRQVGLATESRLKSAVVLKLVGRTPSSTADFAVGPVGPWVAGPGDPSGRGRPPHNGDTCSKLPHIGASYAGNP
jgi:hypothetical protein